MKTEKWGRRAVRLVLATLAFLGAVPAAALAAASDPGVARVSFVEGEASYLNADTDEWSPIETNAPLLAGDRFYSGSGGRAEIQLAGGVYARLASDTEIEILDLSADVVHVDVGIGTAIFRLRQPPANQRVEISTPGAAVVARARGVYRVDVASDGRTTVVVRDGEADAYRGDDLYRLDRGRGAEFQEVGYDYGGEPIEVFDASLVASDDWESWEASRAARVDAAVGYQYVSNDVYGVEDLDEYGAWDRHETYGPIWRPRAVPAGWAPYTTGRWVWGDPYGWTWVDYQPWGWAPSHYGRWVYVSSAWAWAPGPIVAAPAYAPATVGFFGVSVNTPGVSVSVGFGGGPSVGWAPLGWGEPIVPWWGGVAGVTIGRPWWGGWGGPRYVNNTVINNTNINNININNINYRNVAYPGGFTAVSRRGFLNGELDRVDVPRDRFRDFARPVNGALGVVPERQSLAAARPDRVRRGRAVQPPQEVLQRASVASRKPRAQRARFEDRRQLIESKNGAPLTPAELTRVASTESDDGRRSRLVQARGERRVTPEVTAEAPARLGEPLRRTARGGANEQREGSRRAGVGEDATNAERRRDADSARAGRGATGDTPTERDTRGAAGRTGERLDSTSSDRERAAVQRDRDAGRTREEASRSSASERRERANLERGQSRGGERSSAVEAARREQADRDRSSTAAQGDRSGAERRTREEAARQRTSENRSRAAAQSDPGRTQQRGREEAARQRDGQERERAATVQRERESNERRQREEATQRQQESEQRSRAAVQQQQRERESNERRQREEATQRQQESEKRQRDAAAQRERESNARRQQQREQSARRQQESDRQARAASAQRQSDEEKKKQEQAKRTNDGRRARSRDAR
ncbi:MAG: hypothetical protein FJ144_24005 [Deltaproteobacteria bacterium]|nr:hypothetical protein [Deltaproteobacteria bacterium]